MYVYVYYKQYMLLNTEYIINTINKYKIGRKTRDRQPARDISCNTQEYEEIISGKCFSLCFLTLQFSITNTHNQNNTGNKDF